MDPDNLKLRDHMCKYLLASRSDNTFEKYSSYFKRWEDFCKGKGFSPMPASPVQFALYLTSLLDASCSFSVLSSAKYAVKYVHELNGLPDPTNNPFVVNLVESSKRVAKKPVRKKEPITVDHLHVLCDTYKDSTDLVVIRDLAMILLAFAAFLRFDELSNLHCNDISFYDDHFSIHINKSKTDQYRLGSDIVIAKGHTSACPYHMLRKYFELACIDCSSEMFLFRPIFKSKQKCSLIYKNKPLSYTRTRECLVGRLKEAVGDLDIGLHSLRAGGASAAANANVNERCWKRHGRWKTDSAKDGYVADSLESRLSVSKSLDL